MLYGRFNQGSPQPRRKEKNMIRQSSGRPRLTQIGKAEILPSLYPVLTLLILFLSAGVFIGDIWTIREYSPINNAFLLMQKPDTDDQALFTPNALHPISEKFIAPIASITPDKPVDLVQQAYVVVKHALISTGRRHAESILPVAAKCADGSTFAKSLVAFIPTWGSDGMYINWKPLASFFDPKFFFLMSNFSSVFTAISPKPLLTTVATWSVITVRPALELLQTQQNQNPVITYKISTPWPNPVICRDTSSL
jgi:hypothetical protein